MTPAAAITLLDRQIAKSGQTVMLRKSGAVGTADDKPIRAVVRGYQPDELAGGIQQGDSTMVFSPTALARSGFDGPPRHLDRAVVAGKVQVIQVANPVRIGDTIVRWECWMRGS